jgi:FMN-dependent oxidoreductase (nitrilotriacetate monooxygenase family)
MPQYDRKMILALLVNGVGQHQAAWRIADSRAEDAYSLSLYADAARMAEAAKMHMVFLADSADHDQATLRTRPKRFLEAHSIACALASITDRIGLIATFSTTFSEPYNVARQMCTLDHLSKGRAGWNMVTSYGGAEHYGDGPMMEHGQRHKRASEYAQVIRMLFDSWAPDALVIDREAGIYADPAKVRCDRFDGEIFRVAGPLNMPRPPQGRPVIAQAGQSAAGKDLSAHHADMVYAQGTSLEESQAHYADLKGRMGKFGRHPDELKVLPGCVPVIGQTEAEARSMQNQLNDLLDMKVAKYELQHRLPGVPLDDYDLDEVLPASAFPPVETVQTMQTRYEIYRHWAVDKAYTIRNIIEKMTTGGGHWSPCGSAERIAEEMQERFVLNGCDGFNLSSTYQLGGSQRITRLLVPALQAAGTYRTNYEGVTLRENMGLPEPAFPGTAG